jgi:hypothetical protein
MLRHTKTTVALALALGALTPATALARSSEPVGLPGATQADLDDLAQSTSPQFAPAPDGFDWTDAGIGAAAGIGISLIAVGGSFVVVGKRRGYVRAS